MAQQSTSRSVPMLLALLGVLVAGIIPGLRTHLTAQRAMTGAALGRIVGFRDDKGRMVRRPHEFGLPPGDLECVVIYEYTTSPGAPVIRAYQRVDVYAFEASGLRVGSAVAVQYDPRYPNHSQFVLPPLPARDGLVA